MEDLEKQFAKILVDYKLPEKKNVSNKLSKNHQRLALDICKEFNDYKMKGAWLRIAKKNYAFLEDKFLSIKKCANVRNPAACLWSVVHKK
jgi:hypothetical protein